MNIKLLIISAAAVALIGSVELFAQAQQSSGGRPTCMWDMPHDQCMKMMKDCGMGPGMMMRWSMMGSLQVDSNDPAAWPRYRDEISKHCRRKEQYLATLPTTRPAPWIGSDHASGWSPNLAR